MEFDHNVTFMWSSYLNPLISHKLLNKKQK